jgi:hypothetical protein
MTKRRVARVPVEAKLHFRTLVVEPHPKHVFMRNKPPGK